MRPEQHAADLTGAASQDAEALRAALSVQAKSGSQRVAQLARWLVDRPEELAFNSVRQLAAAADVNANTVVRLAKALGFDGYDACRSAFQAAIRTRTRAYAARAAGLRAQHGRDVFANAERAQAANVAAIFSAPNATLVAECAGAMLGARTVVSVGVRSCFSVAHYFSYVGAMAFPNVAQTPAQPGAIMDTVSALGGQDVVLAVTYAHYSLEVVRAAEIARGCGARVIALTDSLAAPVADGAWRVIEMPMLGPHFIPSLTAAFMVVEAVLAEMAARDPDAAARIEAFEARITRHGGYVGED